MGWTLLFIGALTLFRLWFCTRLELVGDEAYYWICSRHLDLSYFDKGPGAAWTIAFGTHLFGDTVFGVRWPAVLLSAGTGIIIYALASRLFSPRVGFWSVIVCGVAPMFAVGSILMTIDPISLFFWAAAALAFWKALQSADFTAWAITGLCLGLGALAKYTNLVELVSFTVFCASRREFRREFRRPGFYLMIAATLVCATPMIIWNSQHDWITVRHLAHRGALDQAWRFSPADFGTFIGQQAGVISPAIFLGVMIALFLPAAPEHRLARSYLLSLFLPLFSLYATLSLNHSAQANWTAPAYLAGFILMVSAWLPLIATRRLKAVAWTALVLAAIETILLHDNMHLLHLPEGRDPMDRAHGWAAMAEAAQERKAAYQADFLLSNGYQNPSLLTFYIPGHPAIYSEPATEIHNQYSLWPGYRDLYPPGTSAIFVSDIDHLPSTIRRDFKNTSRLEPVSVVSHQRTVKSLYFYRCEHLLPPEERE